MRRPVFVVGSPRSGTTLFYHMLLSAGDFVVYHSEAQVFNMIVPRFDNLRTAEARQEFVNLWLSSEFFRRTGLEPGEIAPRILNECRSGADFLRLLMETMAAKQNVHRWSDSTPENLLYIDDIKREFPDALFVHVIRDGRDVALSLSRQGWIRTLPGSHVSSVIASGLYWEWLVEKGIRNLSRHAADVIEVRYESLVAQPEQELKRVGAFIDHDLDYQRILSVGVGSVSAPNSSFERGKSGKAFNPVGRWKSGFKGDELGRLEFAIGGLLTKLGYEKAAPPAAGNARLKLERMMYRTAFGARVWLKTRTPLGRRFTDTSLFEFAAKEQAQLASEASRGTSAPK